MVRRLVQFWAGGRVKKSKAQHFESEDNGAALKRGGKVKIKSKTVNKARGGGLGVRPAAVMPPGPGGALSAPIVSNPMEGRLTTGVVGRPPPMGGRRKMPTVGARMTGPGGRVLG